MCHDPKCDQFDWSFDASQDETHLRDLDPRYMLRKVMEEAVSHAYNYVPEPNPEGAFAALLAASRRQFAARPYMEAAMAEYAFACRDVNDALLALHDEANRDRYGLAADGRQS